MMIKLYSKELHKIKCKTKKERRKIILEYQNKYMGEPLRELEMRFYEKLQNKLYKYFVEVSFYSDETIKEIQEENAGKL